MSTDMNDQYNLQRFVDAQKADFEGAYAELRDGCKRGHWMWYIFPQINGLGHSELSRKFAISSREEAREYMKHPILGRRLEECTQLVTLVDGRTAEQIFGYTDAKKFHSSMTLFASVMSDNSIFNEALRKYFGGEFDKLTLERL